MIKLFSLFWFCPVFSPTYGEQTTSKLHPLVKGKQKKKKIEATGILHLLN